MTAPSSQTSAPAGARINRRRLLRVGLPVILVIVLGVILWIWGTLSYVYSSGERTGYVQRLSKVGWVCKTWEGSLALAPVPGQQQRTFEFTVRDDSVARALELVGVGREVTLQYDQHKGVPGSCFGETQDYVQGFRVVGEP